MREFIWAAACAALLCGGASLAQEAREPEPTLRAPIITHPTWARAPRAAFPDRAAANGVTAGAVELDCGFSANGSFTDCTILSEDPSGSGFGAAALSAARRARLASTAIHAVPSDARVRWRMEFTPDGGAPASR